MGLGKFPRELDEGLSSEDWQDFRALYRIDPWDMDRLEGALARLCAITYNSNVREEHHRRQPREFLPYLKLREASVTRDTNETALWANIRALHAAQKARGLTE